MKLLTHRVINLIVIQWLCLGISYAATLDQTITLKTENEVIYLGDSVIIDVEAIGLVEPLDTSRLFQDADLLRETTGTRIAVFGGRVVEVLLRRMEFIPKRQGRILFGPVTGVTGAGEVHSNALSITVQAPADTNWQPASDDIQVEINIRKTATTADEEDKHLPYIGQRMIADIVLKHRYPISEEQLNLPQFEGFTVLKQYEARRTIENQGLESAWRQTAWRYHLFAERSGDIVIEPVRWSGTMIRSRTQRAAFTRATDAFTLTIQPASDNQDWWLPSSAVTLSDEWSKDPRELTAGDEIIRTVTLNATNVLANQLPDVTPLESQAISTRLIRQERKQQLIGDTITSTAVFQFRMIARSPIPVFLDTVRVKWFNTQTQSVQEAIIPARRINVGLPNRADLLNAIASSDQWWERWLLSIRGYQLTYHFWYIALPLITLAAICVVVRERILHQRHARKIQQSAESDVLPSI